MITFLNTLLFAILLMPDSIKIGCLDLFYLLLLACLLALFDGYASHVQEQLDDYKSRDWRYDG